MFVRPSEGGPNWGLGGIIVGTLALLCTCGAARADDADVEARLRAVEERVKEQDAIIDELRAQSPDGVAIPNLFRVYWKNGLKLGTDDDRFELSIGGRSQFDFGFFTQNRNFEQLNGKQPDASGFRRLRFKIGGTIYERYIFSAEVDFAGGDADFKDVYVGITDVPGVGTLTIGHQHEPFGLETRTSNLHITFMERSVAHTFSPERNTGIRVARAFEGRYTASAGVFRESDDFGSGSGDGDYNLSGRVTALLLDQEEGRRLVHVGGAYSYRNDNGTGMRFRARPEVNLVNRPVDTGTFATDGVHAYGLEGAVVFDSFSAQGEYVIVDADSVPGSSGQFEAGYVFVSYFLTGEHRPYKRSAGVFDRIKPKSNAFEGDGCGCGAWELGFRVSMIDLNSGGIRGGEMTDLTAGVNWYLNPNVKTMFNFVHSDLDRGRTADLAAFRVQVDF